MPRPGPRPYECVRRVWHSDRHQPIRGSLIQEIFRVVNEIHSSKTRKNKEWQEKLPIVVLRAEDIMYSKANSEAEYMDLKTLWDRANDAINTIIRLDETTENTGEILQPCIEAALHLGCIPRRASRSQRNSDTRCYLSHNTQEPTANPCNVLEGGSASENLTTNSLYSHLVKCSTMKPPYSNSEQQRNVNNNSRFSISSNNLPLHCSNYLLMDTFPSSILYSTYPLCPPDQIQCHQTHFSLEQSLGHIDGEPSKVCISQNHIPLVEDALNNSSLTGIGPVPESQEEIDCDLSLRLGPCFDFNPCPGNKRSWYQVAEDTGSNITTVKGKTNDLLPPMEKRFPVFYGDNAYIASDYCLSRLSLEDEILSSEPRMRKRKLNATYAPGQFCWQPKLQSQSLKER